MLMCRYIKVKLIYFQHCVDVIGPVIMHDVVMVNWAQHSSVEQNFSLTLHRCLSSTGHSAKRRDCMTESYLNFLVDDQREMLMVTVNVLETMVVARVMVCEPTVIMVCVQQICDDWDRS